MTEEYRQNVGTVVTCNSLTKWFSCNQ